MAEGSFKFNSLVRHLALISATVTLLWCLIREIALLDIIFRVGVVYISIGILGFAASSQLAKLTIAPGEPPHPSDAELVDHETSVQPAQGNR